MKTFLKVCLGILILVVAASIAAGVIYYAIPYLNAKATWEEDYPTIQQMEQEIVARNIEIDSLTSKVEILEQKVELQERIISERDLQTKISSQLNKLQTSYDRNQSRNNE